MAYMISETNRLNNSTLVLYGRDAKNIKLIEKIVGIAGLNKGINTIAVTPEDLAGYNGGEVVNVEYPDQAKELALLTRHIRLRHGINNGNMLGVIRGKISEDYEDAFRRTASNEHVPVVYFESDEGTYSFSAALRELIAIGKYDGPPAQKVWWHKLPPIERANIERVWQDYRRALEVAINA